MSLSAADRKLYRQDVASHGAVLGDQGRGELIKQYLPEPHTLNLPTNRSPTEPSASRDSKMNLNLPPVRPHTSSSSSSPSSSSPSKTNASKNDTPSSTATTQTQTQQQRKPFHKRRIRPLLKQALHFITFFLIQLIYGIIIRFYHSYTAVRHRLIAITHYHHRTPEYIARDVENLSRIPEHLSVVLKYRDTEEGGLEKLVDEVSELAAWCVSAGVGLLSVYEKQGVLKGGMRRAVEEAVEGKLRSYFGEGEARPSCRVFAAGSANGNSTNAGGLSRQRTRTNGEGGVQGKHINVLLLSGSDGRDTLVDLTRTLTEMAQAKKIRPKDITSDLINTEISATTAVPDYSTDIQQRQPPRPQAAKEVGAGEPDLVIIFGPYVKLDGYPPWQIRLSEIFCTGGDPSAGKGNYAVEYQGFLRGLWRFAGAEMRFGR